MSGEIRSLLGIARAYKARVRRYEAVTLLRIMGVSFDAKLADQSDRIGPE